MSTDNSTTTTGNPFAPTDETSWDILNDSVNLIGSTTICGISYGVAITLLAICIATYRKQTRNTRALLYQIIYVSVMAIFGTLYVASNARTMQLAYVNNRLFPAGPAQYDLVIFFTPDTIFGLVSFFAAGWMCDALLLWRLFIIYKTSLYRIPIMILPALLFLASLSMSIVTIINSTRPDSSFWSTVSVKFALAYYSLTMAFTVVSTVLMISRLLLFRRRFRAVLGREHAGQYTNIAALLIESSALYSLWTILFVGLYIVNHPVQYVFLASLAEVQIIAPLLIILRVMQGKAWDSGTEQTLSSFQTKGSYNSRYAGSSMAGTRIGSEGGADSIVLQVKKDMSTDISYSRHEVDAL
ncbi:hypothetical protein K435DRAFT_644058 [Dendrothele bispora CBS 962.96]|uniref:G-protein coupled receptors family 1 profile domain-containing protein n=1 Tax=Dendrothele bispora (strain CBS 962.96) TaxID=1314807 RepID=A0A4S8MVI2_DENBC|nr:hypothetical protein K435DRAFT_644058 [Dendrothele bispora CBS 962.96]